MADKKLFFTVGADVTPGTRGFEKLARDAKKSMGEVDSAVDDTRTNAQRVAAALEGVFEGVDASMMETKAAADKLAQALGPELAAKIDTKSAVAEFERLGLTLDEIKADADTLAGALKKADDVSLKHFAGEADNARVQTDGLAKSAGSSKSVLANMIGNSVQDLGAFAGVAGSAGVAAGQMGEYMADAAADGDKLGDIVGNFGKVVGPLALLSVGTMALSKAMENAAESRKFDKEQIEGYTDAIREGTSATDAFIAKVQETGRLDYRSSAGILSSTEDLIPVLQDANIKLGQFDQMVEMYGKTALSSRDAEIELRTAIRDTGVAEKDAITIAYAARKEHEARTEAAENAARVDQILSDVVAEQTREYILAAGGAVRLAAATDDLSSSTDDAASAAERLRRKTDELGAEWDELQGNLDDDSAFMSLQDQFGATKEAALLAWDAAAKGADDAGERQRDYQRQVQSTKEAVADYGRQIGLLPRQVETYLRLADNGEIAEMERRLAILTRNRSISVSIIQRGGAGYEGGLTGARHSGGQIPTAAQGVLVGEHGPEFVGLPVGSQVLNQSETKRLASGEGGGGRPVNVTVIMPPGSDGRDVVRKLRRYERSNGPGWRAS